MVVPTASFAQTLRMAVGRGVARARRPCPAAIPAPAAAASRRRLAVSGGGYHRGGGGGLSPRRVAGAVIGGAIASQGYYAARAITLPVRLL